MGAVYEAEQDNPRRTVALKMIKPEFTSSQALRRFELESHVLGRLQHPGIAQIYEAGTAHFEYGPQPFFAMEFVRGQTLLQYADARQLATHQRLDLVACICDAVHHAHQKGVIHRDIKPNNIVVDEAGQPKVLDFGVARVTDSELQATMQTSVGQIVGTLSYMSPEQVSGDPAHVDVRSDVYSLGVVLYELLSGKLPVDVAGKVIHEAVRLILDSEQTPLSSIHRMFRGDIETIVGKALEKEKDRRYGSAAELAADIRRHLADKPIVARRPSTTYQLRKFATRNRKLVSAIGALFAALTLGLVVSTWQALRATNAEWLSSIRLQLAEQRRLEADAVRSFLEQMLGSANPELLSRENLAKGRDVSVFQVLHDAVRKLDAGALDGQPLVEAAVRRTIGDTYRVLGEYDFAEPNLLRSLELSEQTLGPEHEDVAACLESQAQLLHEMGKLADAERLFRRAVVMNQVRLGNDHLRTAKSKALLAGLLKAEEKLDEATALYDDALAIERRQPGHEVEVARILNDLAQVLSTEGKVEEAERQFLEAISIQHRVLGTSHPDLANTLHNFAILLTSKGEREEAETVFRQVVAMWRELLGNQHPFLAASLVNLGVILKDQGKLDEAEPIYREAIEIQRSALGDNHPDLGATLYNFAKLLQAENNSQAAEPILRQALAIHRKSLPDGHPTIAAILCGLGSVLTDLDQPREAEPLLKEAVSIYEQAAAQGDWRQNQAKSLLGAAVLKQHRFAEAEGLLLESYNKLKDDPAVSKDRSHQALARLVRLYEAWHQAAPSPERDARAAEWREKLAAKRNLDE